jgi:alpha-1,2-mannosyltransferase
MVDRAASLPRPPRSERWLSALAERRHYALFLGAAFWLLMLSRVVTEGGRWTRDGLPIGWDFHVFRSAAMVFSRGLGARLYDHAVLERVAWEALPGNYPVFVYVNPPHFAALFLPFTGLPYGLALAAFTGASVLLLFFGVRLLSRGTTENAISASKARTAAAYALSSYPVAVGLFSGQSTFLSLFLAALASVCALQGRAFTSGCLVGALLYKPQLVVGFLVFFALQRPLRRRAAAGFALVLALSVVANLLVSVDASRAYVEMLDELPAVQTRYRLALAFTARAFFEQLIPSHPGVAAWLAGALSVATVLVYVRWARGEPRVSVKLAGAVWLTLAVTPHASVYEWTLLIVPLALLRGVLEERRWVVAATALFIVSYLSPPLSEAMTDRFGFGLQLAVPVLFATALYVARALGAR